jgi:hypothetical protein
MTGPEHFEEAERLLAIAGEVHVIATLPTGLATEGIDAVREKLKARGIPDPLAVSDNMRVDVTPVLLAAQVHATLALAAGQLRSLAAS